MANATGLTPEQIEKARALYLYSTDPENNPDPNAPEPIPMFDEESDVQDSPAYTNNVQEEEMYGGDFDEFSLAGPDGPADEEPSKEPENFEGFQLAPLPEPVPEPTVEPEPTAGDYGRIGMAGLAATGGMVAGLLEYTSNMVGVDIARDVFGAARRSADEANEYWRSGMSEAGKRDAAKEYATTGSDAAWKDLDSVMFTILGSLPSTVLTMGPAGAAAKAAWTAKLAAGGSKAAAKKAAATAAVLAGAATEGGLGAGGIASDITSALEAMPLKQLQQMDGYKELKAKFPGMSDEDIRLGVIANATRWNAAIGGAITAAVGAIAGPVESRIFTQGMGLPKRFAVGAASEGVQEGIQSPVETVMSNLGLEKDVTDNLLESTIAGVVGGMGAGGPFAAVTGGGGEAAPIQDAAADLAGEIDARVASDTPVADAAQEADLQQQEAETRVADMEAAQQAARDEVAAEGGDLLDQEMAAAEVSETLGREEDNIKRHLASMQQRIDSEAKIREEQDTLQADIDKAAQEEAKQKEKDLAYSEKRAADNADKMKDNVKRVQEKADLEAYRNAKVDKESEERKTQVLPDKEAVTESVKKSTPDLKIGQTGVDGHITEQLDPKQKEGLERTAQDPVRNDQMAKAFRAAAEQSATSPTNNLPDPTPAQKEKGNYQKGHARLHGLEITVENPAGSTRTAADGSWSQDMKDHYGYIRGTESAEGPQEQLDVFVGDDPESPVVSVVDQINSDGTFDEHKVMFAYPNAVAARRAYVRNYPKAFKVGRITTMSVEKFKQWLDKGDQTVPLDSRTKVGDRPADVASPQKEVIQPKTRKGGAVSRAEQIEDRLVEPRGKVPKRIRYRKKADVEARIKDVAPDDVMEELEYLSEGFEDGPDLVLALDDAIDVAESEEGGRKFLKKLRKVGIEVGMYREITEDEIARTQTTAGKVHDFVMNKKKYAFNDAWREARQDDNKAVDEKGVPLKMYHGQPRPKGEAISRFKQSDRDGTYFSTSSKYAEGYAKEFRAEQRDPAFDSFDNTGVMYQTELDIRNPLVIEEGSKNFERDLEKYQTRGYDKKKLQEDGYDGVMVKYKDGEVEAMVLDGGQVTSVAGKGKRRVRYRLGDDKGGAVRATHYSGSKDLGTLEGARQGTGIRGQEAMRLSDPAYSDIRERVYFYGPGHKKELGLGPHKYSWKQEGIYDIDNDPDGFRAEVRAWAKEKGISADRNTMANELDRRVMAAGYAGMMSENINKIGYVYGDVALPKDGDVYFADRAMETVEAEISGNSRTTLIYLTPDEFLNMAFPLRDGPSEQKLREVGELVEGGTPLHSTPMLSFVIDENGDAVISGHEGRHRALVLKKKGVKQIPVRFTSSGYGEGPEIRWNYNTKPLPKTLIGEGRDKEMPFPVKQDNRLKYRLEDEPAQGREFRDFFSAVTKGLTGESSTGAEYIPVIESVGRIMGKTGSGIGVYSTEYIKHRGKFDDHIAFSIPGYKEVQISVGAALAAVYGKDNSMLDIGASEGSFAKAVTSISGMKTTSLDPNLDMESSFEKVSTVPGAEYSMSAFGKGSQEGKLAWQEDTDDGPVDVEYFDPMGKKYDVVHEAMVFQFMSNEHEDPADRVMERKWQIERVKELMTPDGLFITEEKLHTDNSAANEAKKNKDHKARYFKKEDLDAKSAEVLEGMHKNMVTDSELESILAANFVHVRQFWDSGNFKGYVASDSIDAVENMLGSMTSLESDFSTTETPRVVQKMGDTDTAAFKNWFDGSYVKNDDGTPKIVYHGTNESGFVVFNAEETVGRGSFFSDDPNVAMSYQGNRDEFVPLTAQELFDDKDAQEASGIEIIEGYTAVYVKGGEPVNEIEVYPTKEEYLENNELEDGERLDKVYTLELDTGYTEIVAGTKAEVMEYLREADQTQSGPGMYYSYLALKDPLVVDFGGNNWDEGPRVDEYYDGMSTNQIVTEARAEGYDGVIMENVIDDGYSGGTGDTSTIYVAFKDSQIKSVYNQGTWDPKEGHILLRKEGESRGFNSFQAKEVLQPLLDKMPLLNANIVLDSSEMPADLVALMDEDDAAGARGVYDTETGELYVLADNHQTKEDLINTLLHEGLAHKGLRLLLKEDFEDVMADIYANGDQAMIKSIARKYDLDLNDALDRQDAADEYIAFMAENDIESSVFQKAVAAVRQALRDLGLVKLWTEADIKALLRRSRKNLRGKPLSKATIKTEYEIAETGETVQVSERADVALRKAEQRIAICKKVKDCVS